MKHVITTALLASLSFLSTPVSAQMSDTATAWETVLQARLSAPDETGLTRFDYKGFSASTTEMAALDDYIAELAKIGEPEDASEATAYWANLYNAITVDVVAENYPVKSIRDIKSGVFSPGPWKQDAVTVEGKTLSLDDIEHQILRKRYSSPLIHYMVNCASVGCPNLRPQLWAAETLDADREQAARDFINSPRGVSVSGDGKIQVSSIYKWFEEDFGGSKSGVIDHINAYANSSIRTSLTDRTRYDSHNYDWSLNGQ